MKRIIVSFVIALLAISIHAQQTVGHFSLIPRAGVCIANISGNKIYYETGSKPMDAKYNARFVGGLDLEYQALPTTSVSIGASYSQQGCRLPNFGSETQEGAGGKTSYSGWTKFREKLDYIQFPLMVNQYITEGLAVKVGVQYGILTNAEVSYNQSEVNYADDGSSRETQIHHNDDIKGTLKKYDLSIPIGFSYEYQNVILDARYNFGLTSLYEVKDMPKEKNRFFTITVGYRIF